uniref:Uncharacterized protein n=1 Tax=Sphenodon punctatus TaxID=8508 RepID=A0A8D0GYZ5_SPHPU
MPVFITLHQIKNLLLHILCTCFCRLLLETQIVTLGSKQTCFYALIKMH